MSEQLHKGLEGIVVAESSLSFIDGDTGTLSYHGYPIESLAREASFEEVAYLLWYGHLPTADELADFSEAMAEERAVAPEIIEVVRTLAAADEDPMAVVRTITSMLSAWDPDAEAGPEDHEANIRTGRRLTAKLPTAVAAYTRFREGKEALEVRSDLSHAAHFLYLLNGEVPDAVLEETFDAALVLHADHGLNASTFAAMVTASTLADLHSAVTSAVCALSGPLHGGANQNVMRMLLDIDGSGKSPTDWVADALAAGERIPGFGHRVYNVKDPRARILGAMSDSLGEAAGDTRWHEYSVALEEYMTEEKGLAPNVDFYSASTYYQMGIPMDIYTAIFAMSRVTGWVAHVLEEWEDNRLIRPRARYVGPKDERFVPMDER